jgi:hypothetical protein
MATIQLVRRDYPIIEPVLGDLRKIIDCYNGLSAQDAKGQVAALGTIIRTLVGKKTPPLWLVSAAEITTLLTTLPELLGLEAAGNGDVAVTWGDSYAHLAMTLGWEYDYIDRHLTLSKLKDMQGYLKKNPSVHQLVAAFMGYEPEPDPQQSVRNLFAKVKSMMGGSRVH